MGVIHDSDADLGRRHTIDDEGRFGDVAFDLAPEWAPSCRERHLDGDVSVRGDVDTPDHAEVDDGGPEFGVEDPREPVADRLDDVVGHEPTLPVVRWI